MPYIFTLPGFFPVQNLDEYGCALLRKGFRGLSGFKDGRKVLPTAHNLLDQLFSSGFGGPSRDELRSTRNIRDFSNIGNFSDTKGQSSESKDTITSLPKIKEAAEKAAQLIYRRTILEQRSPNKWNSRTSKDDSHHLIIEY